jgi:hypothetical protein
VGLLGIALALQTLGTLSSGVCSISGPPQSRISTNEERSPAWSRSTGPSPVGCDLLSAGILSLIFLPDVFVDRLAAKRGQGAAALVAHSPPWLNATLTGVHHDDVVCSPDPGNAPGVAP